MGSSSRSRLVLFIAILASASRLFSPPERVEISLYGMTKGTYERVTRVPGSFEKCLAGIRRLVERGQFPFRNYAALSGKKAWAHYAERGTYLDDKGNIVARYDKLHLFDVDLANGETYRESATVRPGTL